MRDHVQSSARRIVVRAALLVVPLMLAAAAAPWLLERMGRRGPGANPDRLPTAAELYASRRADARLAETEQEAWGKSTSIAPQEAAPDASGERVRWFQGFGVSVETTPPGAAVLVNGRALGETPLTTSVQCKPGEPVRVEVRKQGLRTQRRATRCREDLLVELSFELR